MTTIPVKYKRDEARISLEIYCRQAFFGDPLLIFENKKNGSLMQMPAQS
jgi:hypothetical protein